MELQKINLYKRISAWLFDRILLVIAVIGFALLFSGLLGYDSYSGQLAACQERIAGEYGVTLELSASEYDALQEEEKSRVDEAMTALNEDPEALYLYSMLLNLTVVIITFGLLCGFLLLELAVPLLIGNGQTLGKKIFGAAVMRRDFVKLPPVLLFARTVLGKFTLETMVPVLLLLAMSFGFVGLLGLGVIGVLLLIQLILLIVTPARTPLHDLIAQTVVVDLASQRIFDTPEAREEYRARHQSNSGDSPVKVEL